VIIWIHTHTYIYIYTHTHIYTYIHTYICIYIYICRHLTFNHLKTAEHPTLLLNPWTRYLLEILQPFSWCDFTSPPPLPNKVLLKPEGSVPLSQHAVKLIHSWENSIQSTTSRFMNFSIIFPSTAKYPTWTLTRRFTECNYGSISHFPVCSTRLANTNLLDMIAPEKFRSVLQTTDDVRSCLLTGNKRTVRCRGRLRGLYVSQICSAGGVTPEVYLEDHEFESWVFYVTEYSSAAFESP
jgi:hypothetical protein